MLCCKSTEDPKQIKQQKVETIRKGILGGFLVLSVTYHGYFWHGLSEDLTSTFPRGCRCARQKIHIIFLREGSERFLWQRNLRNVNRIGFM